MTDSQQNPHKLTLGHLLANVSRLVGIRTRMKLQEFGLHHAQGMILFHLWREDGLAQNVLAQALNITPPTTTNTLQRMERNGWIRRRRDKTDQRIVRVYLTNKARALRQEVRNTFQELDRELMAVLSENELNILMASLLKVHYHLSQKIQP
ncbi:MAG: MarR family transcriptional regulator [Desulfobacterales bacterium]|nr:MarR family transcriptional regulator [Desulfobacterales bacterium]